MSKTQLRVARRVVSTLTATATAITMLGSAAIGLAAVPADFGLVEGDTISANAQAGDPDVYIVNEHGYKRLFVNPAIFGLYGHLSFAGVKQVSAATRDAFPTSGLFRNCESGSQRVYGLDVISEDVANLRWVNTSGAQAVADDPDFFKKVFCINNNEQALYGTGPDYNSVLDVPDYNRDGGSTPSTPVAGFNPNGGTQGAIDTQSLGSPDETELMEGQTEELYAVDIELLPDGPLRLDTADLWIAETDGGGHDQKPWTYFEEICAWLNGVELGCRSADRQSDWTDSTDGNIDGATTTSEYRMRFTGLNGVMASDDTSMLAFTFSAMNNFDSGDMEGATWNVELGQIRITDESGLTTNSDVNGFATSTTLEDSFTIGSSDESILEVRESNNEIDAKVIEVSDTTDTGWVDIYRMTVEETGDVGGTIDDIVLTFAARSSLGANLAENSVFKRARIDASNSSPVCGEEAVPDGGVVTFDNCDLDYDAEEEFDITVQVQFRDTNNGARYKEGTLASVSATVGSWTFDDDNGNDEGDNAVTGTAQSEQHELRTEGLKLALVSTSATNAPSGISSVPDTATFKIVFDATAFGSNIFVEETCGEDAGDGVSYVFNDNTASPSAQSCSVTSTATKVSGNNNFRVNENQTKRFTLTVVADGEDAFFRVGLQSVDWATTDIAEPLNVYNFDLEDYETDDVYSSDN